MVVQHNLQAMNTNRMLGITTNQVAKSTEKLSSGYKVNWAADDAAGLAISEKMRKQIRGLGKAASNIEEGISFVQTADGALDEVDEMLQRMNELAIQSANGTNSPKDREYIDLEIQEIKNEMERVFTTTEFNEKLIWPDPVSNTVVNFQNVGKEEAVTLVNYGTQQQINVNNDNYQFMPVCIPQKGTSRYSPYYVTSDSTAEFILNADKNNGLSISWTAYNGNKYTSDSISWYDLASQGNTVNIGDLLTHVTYEDTNGNRGTTSLIDRNGNPCIEFDISLSRSPHATGTDLEEALDGIKITYSADVTLNAAVNTFTSSDVNICYANMTAAAAYADRMKATQNGLSNCFSYESTSVNTFIPNGTGNFSESVDGLFTFSFIADGLGAVTASCTNMAYYATAQDHRFPSVYSNSIYNDDDENIWWSRTSLYNNRYLYMYQGKAYLENNPSTVDGIKECLLGTKASGHYGVLTEANGGATNGGGYVILSFDLKSDIPYSYGKNQSSNIVGIVDVQVKVDITDTETSVFQKIRNAMNSSSIMSLTTRKGSSSIYFGDKEKSVSADIEKREIFETFDYSIDFNIHSGSEKKDKILIEYNTLRLKNLGLENTNVLTQYDSLKCIDEISHALTIINSERSRFGSYQNRMMHAYNIDMISQENTQAGESQIRDTDFADELVKNANEKILQQAGQSMLAQANQSNQMVLSLLS